MSVSQLMALFDSKMEAARYQELKLMQHAGIITELRAHECFPIVVNDHFIANYIPADFTYTEDGQRVVEDVKGMRLDLYKIKGRLLKAIYGIDIMEITKR